MLCSLLWLYRNFPLAFYFTCGSVYISATLSFFSPSSSSTVSTGLLSTTMSLFLLSQKVHQYHFCRFHQFSSVTQSCLTVQFHALQHARLPCPSPTPGACSNSCPLSQWCHPTISSSVIPFPSCLQSFPASGSFQMSQFFASGGQSIGVSASTSILPMNIQD